MPATSRMAHRTRAGSDASSTAAVCKHCRRSIAVRHGAKVIVTSKNRSVIFEAGKPPVATCRHCGMQTPVVPAPIK